MAAGTVTIKILGDASHFKRAAFEADSVTGRLAGAMDNVGKSMQRTGATMTKSITLPLAGIAAIGTKMAADYEQSMDILQSVTGATGAEMKKLSDLTIQLGADIKLPSTSAKDASEAMLELSKAGLSVKDTMDAARGVLQLSAASGLSNAESAEIAANALNAFSLSGDKAADVANQLAATANASSVEVKDVADSFKMAAAVFSAFQGPAVGAEQAMQDLNTAIGVLGNLGIKGSDAGTSLKQMLLQLTGPSLKAKKAMEALYLATLSSNVSMEDLTKGLGTAAQQNEALASMSKTAGVEVGAVGDIAFTASGDMRSLTEIIALVTEGTARMTEEQRNAYLTQIFGADATRAVVALMKEGTDGWNEMSAAVDNGSAAADMAAAKNKGLKGAIDALQSVGETFLLTVVLPMVPAFTSVVEKVSALITGFSNLNPNIQTAILAGLALLAALGPLVSIIGTVVTVVGALSAALAFLAANPVVLVIAAIAALAAGLVYAYNTSETFQHVVETVFDAVVTAVKFMADVFVTAFNWIKEHIDLILIAGLGPLGAAIVLLRHNWETVWNAISAAVSTAWGIIEPIVGMVVGAASKIVNAVEDVIGALSKIPGAGGLDVGSMVGDLTGGKVQKFATGGMVAGPIGSPQLAVVHGGEQVLTPAQQRGAVAMIPLSLLRPGDMLDGADLVAKLIEFQRRNGPIRIQVA